VARTATFFGPNCPLDILMWAVYLDLSQKCIPPLDSSGPQCLRSFTLAIRLAWAHICCCLWSASFFVSCSSTSQTLAFSFQPLFPPHAYTFLMGLLRDKQFSLVSQAWQPPPISSVCFAWASSASKIGTCCQGPWNLLQSEKIVQGQGTYWLPCSCSRGLVIAAGTRGSKNLQRSHPTYIMALTLKTQLGKTSHGFPIWIFLANFRGNWDEVVKGGIYYASNHHPPGAHAARIFSLTLNSLTFLSSLTTFINKKNCLRGFFHMEQGGPHVRL